MWAYYQSQVASARSAAQEPDADNNKTALAYRNMIDQLHVFAERIRTPDIRTKADTIVAINRDVFDQWKRWVAVSQYESPVETAPTASDRRFAIDFAQDAKKLQVAHAELESVCPS